MATILIVRLGGGGAKINNVYLLSKAYDIYHVNMTYD